MKRRPALIALALIVLAVVGFAGWYFFLRVVRPDFDKTGGTILVYKLPDETDAEAMAKVLQVRTDPDDRGEAVLRVIDKNLIEIRIPRVGEGHAEEVVRIKELVLVPGELELMILANSVDDKLAIKMVKDALNFEDSKLKKQLKELQEAGLPPPRLIDPATKEPMVFSIDLAKGEKSQVTYRWVELGPMERASLNLNNENPEGSMAGQDAAKNLGKAATWREIPDLNILVMNGALFYGRTCANKNLPEKEQWKKAVDYFVLARDPELDPRKPAAMPVEKRRTQSLDSSLVASVSGPHQRDHHWYVSTTFNAEGGELLHIMSRKNASESNSQAETPHRRYLGIVLDGVLLSAPTINSEIPGGQMQISGAFSETEGRNLAALLRSGTLPGRLTWFSERKVGDW